MNAALKEYRRRLDYLTSGDQLIADYERSLKRTQNGEELVFSLRQLEKNHYNYSKFIISIAQEPSRKIAPTCMQYLGASYPVMEQILSYANLIVGNSISTKNTSQNREVVIPEIKLELALSYLIEYQLLLQKNNLNAVSFLAFEGNLCGNIKSDKLAKLNEDLIKGLSNLKFHLFGKRGVNDFETLQNVLDPLAKKERKKVILSSLAILSTGLILGPMVLPYAYAQLPVMMRLVSSGLIVSTMPSSYQTAKTIFDLVNEDDFKMIGHSRKLIETLKMILSPGLSLQNLLQLVVIYESSLEKDFEINHPLKWGETWLSDLKKKYSHQEIIDMYLERHQIISTKLESL